MQPAKVEVLCICKNCQLWKKVSRCNGCGLTYYCSKECQKKDWARHKPICLVTSEGASTASKLTYQGVIGLKDVLVKFNTPRSTHSLGVGEPTFSDPNIGHPQGIHSLGVGEPTLSGSPYKKGSVYSLNIGLEWLALHQDEIPLPKKLRTKDLNAMPPDSDDYINIIIVIKIEGMWTTQGCEFFESYLLRFQ